MWNQKLFKNSTANYGGIINELYSKITCYHWITNAYSIKQNSNRLKVLKLVLLKSLFPKLSKVKWHFMSLNCGRKFQQNQLSINPQRCSFTQWNKTKVLKYDLTTAKLAPVSYVSKLKVSIYPARLFTLCHQFHPLLAELPLIYSIKL